MSEAERPQSEVGRRVRYTAQTVLDGVYTLVNQHLTELKLQQQQQEQPLLLHCVSKKQDNKLLPITSPNVNRFSKFFHW